MTRGRFDRVHVVVPARDEEDHLGGCLDSVLTAAHVVRRDRGCEVAVTVVLDACVDASAEVALRRPGVEVLPSTAGLVGAARRLGVAHALARAHRPTRTWIACTDADTLVPPDWLSGQLELADDGYDLVVGTVAPDPEDLAPGALRAWWDEHRLGEGHEHVHGANLGFALAAYDAVGGFAPVATGEDVDLVLRLRASGVQWRATDRTRVLTSGRHRGRVEDGFAGFLRELEREAG